MLMTLLAKVLSKRKLKPVFATLGLGTCLAGLSIWAIFQGLLLPESVVCCGPPPITRDTETLRMGLYYLMLLGACLLSGLYVGDLGHTLAAFLASYLMSAVIIYQVLVFPGLTSSDTAFRESLAQSSVNWTFHALFPFPLFLGLFATIVGAWLQETIVG